MPDVTGQDYGSLLSFYQPNSQIQAFGLGDIERQRAQAQSQAALQSQLLFTQFQQRGLPAQANQDASMGRFFSGMTGQRASNIAEDSSNANAQVQLTLNQQLNDLRRQAFMTNLGVAF
jgi:hypothetical protein